MNYKIRVLVLQSALFALLFLLGGSVGHAQLSAGTVVNPAQMAGDQSECAIAKNPLNKLQLFLLCNNNAGAGLFAARSVDGGLSWLYPDPSKTIANGANPALGTAACCDPTLSWDSFGNLFIAYIDSTLTNIVVLLSQDGGQTFTSLNTFGPFTSPDQPTIVTGNTSALGAPVAVWIVWHQNAPTGPMVASGAAVTGPGAVGAFSALQNIPGTNDCSYGDVAIAISGAVVQVCQTPSTGDSPAPTTKLLVNTKPDGLGPNPFNAAVTATTTNVGAFHPIPAQASRTIDSEAGLAYDTFGASPHFRRLYMVYTEEPTFGSGSTQILLRTSDDDGGTWSAPIRVDDDSSGRSKFFPKIGINPLSGNIAVCWYDARNSTTNTAMEVFCTMYNRYFFPTPIGPNLQVSAALSPSSASPNQFGDYSGLAYFQGLAHPAWPDTSNSTGDNPDGTTTFDIYTNRVNGGAASQEGDPHLVTVDKVSYDFQGAGEYVSLIDGDQMEIQTRQTPVPTASVVGPNPHTGLTTCVSLNTAVAARVGKHRVTYEPNISGVPDPSGLQLRVDGKLTTLTPNGLDLGDGGRVAKTGVPGGLEVDFPDESILFITPAWWTSQSKWYLNVDVSRTSAMLGLLGAIPNGSWLPLLPNGSSMGPMPSPLHQRYVDLYHKFGNAWRVTDKTTLFDYRKGTSTKTFTMNTWPPEQPKCTIPGTKPARPVSVEVAQQACRIIEDKNTHANCVFDVQVTGNLGFAKTYALSHQVLTGSTAITVTDDKNPTKMEEPVTFTAIVTALGKGIPAGTVQFMVDGYKAGEPMNLDGKGHATWKTAALKPGRHKVSATYTPGQHGEFMPSSSADHIHVVRGGDND